MLEILFVVFLCRTIGERCRKKHVGPLPFQIMLVVCWLGGEFFGAVVGQIMSPNETAAIYGFALLGAGVGAGFTFLVVSLIPANAPPARSSSSPQVGLPRAGSPAAGAPYFGPPQTAAAVGPQYVARSDAEAQAYVQQAQACEARQDWMQAVNFWRLVAEKAVDPQWISYGQQRATQLYQWLASQQAPAAQRPV